jgi:MFS family permease
VLIGGVWADRLPRARVMLAADVARAALHTLLAVLIFTDAVEIWHLVLIEACFGTAEAFSIPAYNGLVPRTVPAEEVQDAQALSGFTFNLASSPVRRSLRRSCSGSAPAGRSFSMPAPSS